MCLEIYEYVDKLLLEFVPQRTFHRQSLPQWITPGTSNLMKRPHTKKQMLKRKSPEQRLSNLSKSENQVISKWRKIAANIKKNSWAHETLN